MKRFFYLSLLISFSGTAFAAADESTFLQRLDSFPRSDAVISVSSDASIPYDFIYGPVDKIKRDVFFDRVKRVTAKIDKITYSIPNDVKREEVMTWYVDRTKVLGGNVLYGCHGPDCGRATVWASQVYKLRELSALNRDQSYVAAVFDHESSDQILLSVYVVERGNKRIYAHVEVAKLDESVIFEGSQDIGRLLARNGYVVLDGIVPTDSGTIPSKDLDVLAKSAAQLAAVPSQGVYVVCHIHAPRDAEVLLKASERCANEVADVLSANSNIQATSVGVGPLIPVEGLPQSRVEIVIPSLIRRD